MRGRNKVVKVSSSSLGFNGNKHVSRKVVVLDLPKSRESDGVALFEFNLGNAKVSEA